MKSLIYFFIFGRTLEDSQCRRGEVAKDEGPQAVANTNRYYDIREDNLHLSLDRLVHRVVSLFVVYFTA